MFLKNIGIQQLSLRWQRGWINMDRPEESDESEQFDTIHVNVDAGRDSEDFILRKYRDGEVKAYWLRDPVDSILLDEEFGDELTEVPLTSERVKRIGQVVVSAQATTIAGITSR